MIPLHKSATGRSQLACARACRAHDDVIKLVHQVSEDLDQITMPGVPVEIQPEDSLVTTIEEVLEDAKPKIATGG